MGTLRGGAAPDINLVKEAIISATGGVSGLQLSPLGRGGPAASPTAVAAATAAYNSARGHGSVQQPAQPASAAGSTPAEAALKFTPFRVRVHRSDAWRLWLVKQQLGVDSQIFMREDLTKKQRLAKFQQAAAVESLRASGVKISWRADKLLNKDQITGKYVAT